MCPQFPIQVPVSRPEAIKVARMAQVDVKTYSDGSGIDGGIGAAAMLYRNGELKATLRNHPGKEDQHTVFELGCP